MAKLGRPGMSDEDRATLWRLWSEGSSFSEISREIGYPPGSIYTVVKQTGGYLPPERRRRDCHLASTEREEISRGLARGDSIRAIARQLGRAPSTISREIARNKGRHTYRAVDADDRAWRRARRPHLTHTVTLHLGNASLPGIETRSYTRIIPRQRGFSADAHPHKHPPHEQSGLDDRVQLHTCPTGRSTMTPEER